MVLPVVAELERRAPDIDVQLLALTTGHLPARAHRAALGYRDFVHAFDATAVEEWGRKMLDGNTSPAVPTDESVAYLGINYLDLVDQYGPEEAADRYRELGRYAFRPLGFMRRVIGELLPDVVIATNSPRSQAGGIGRGEAHGNPDRRHGRPLRVSTATPMYIAN